MSRKRLATVWLDGCSGCHMSLLDMDERLIELSALFDLVYSPLVDHKTYPEAVDIVLVEGSVSTDEDLEKIHMIRERSKTLVSLGDCAVTGNVPSMRNTFSVASIMERAFGSEGARFPSPDLPRPLPKVVPVHEVITVDVFVPGCPPSANTIHYVLRELLADRVPDVTAMTRFGV